MLTVYLDQNKWIALAQAETGHRDGAPHVETLAVLKRAADEGRARFPLGATHYYETAKKGDQRKRLELAATMARLAGTVRIAPPQALVPLEIERALVEVFSLEPASHDLPVFGDGTAHAFAAPGLAYQAPQEWGGVALPEHLVPELQRRGAAAWEAMLLASTDVTPATAEARVALNKLKVSTDARFVQGQQEIAQAISEHGRRQLRDALLVSAWQDIRTPLAEASYRREIPPELVAARWAQILEAIPSRWTEMKLREFRHSNPQKAWSGNDLNDVIALSVAIPYCDMVVTEKSWASMLTDAKVGARFDGVVTRSFADVVTRLS